MSLQQIMESPAGVSYLDGRLISETLIPLAFMPVEPLGHIRLGLFEFAAENILKDRIGKEPGLTLHIGLGAAHGLDPLPRSLPSKSIS